MQNQEYITHLLDRLEQAGTLFLFILLLFYHDTAAASALDGLTIWAITIVPTLFPFILASKLLLAVGIPELLLEGMKKCFPSRRHLQITFPLFLLGLCCGFPVGALFIHHSYKTHQMTKKEAQNMLPLSSFFNPMFLLGYAVPTLHIKEPDILVFFVSLYGPIVLLYLFDLIFAYRTSDATQDTELSLRQTDVSRPDSLSDLIVSSLWLIFTIGVYIMLFHMLYDILMQCAILRHPLFQIVLSNLEITSGLLAYQGISLEEEALYLSIGTAMLSFGGFCTMAQVHATIADTDLSILPYIRRKCILSLASGLLLYMHCHL